MDQRIKFIAAVLDGTVRTSSLAMAFGISRKTAYKWIDRYKAEGPEGLRDRSKAARHHPNAVTFEMERLLIAERKRHPTWGPRKILTVIGEKDPTLHLPSHSTVSELYQEKGLVKHSRRRNSIKWASPKQAPRVLAEAPNDVWATDFKGDFKMLDGQRCNPLTISDLHSRFVICCQGLLHKTYEDTRKYFQRAFHEYGLPSYILSDNGPPFSSSSGLSQLAVWWIKLNILPVRIEPGKPQQNGSHERMHRTLGQEAIQPPRSGLRTQQRAFDAFVQEFNYERPHEALGQKTPASFYKHSPRPYPSKLPEFEYPAHFEVRRVASTTGAVKLHGESYFLTHSLSEENIGLEPIDDGLWRVHFGGITLGVLDQTTKTFSRTFR